MTGRQLKGNVTLRSRLKSEPGQNRPDAITEEDVMSRWDANSDLDYTDEPWAAKLFCIERGCENERATFSVFCATCLSRHEEKLAEQRARELAERRKSA